MRKKIKGGIVGYASLGLLGIVVLALLFPIVDIDASASEPSTDSVMSTSVNTNTVALVRSSIAVALSSVVNFDITPQSNGAFSTSAADLMVTTNNTTGYQVYLQTLDNSSQLNPVKADVETSIMPVAGELDSTNYKTKLNTWGYRVGTTEGYTAVPKAGDTPIIKTEGASREDSYTLGFAVAVGADLPSGVYKNELVASVVANPIEVRSLNDITYMQEMTPEICTISYIDETKQLIDTRDGKSYWVAKLKDGNCWMVQNLALDLKAGTTYTAADTDLESTETKSWKVLTSTEQKIPSANTANDYQARSWYLGEIVATSPTGRTQCESEIAVSDLSDRQTIADLCPSNYKDVSGWNGTFKATADISYDELTSTYDPRYLVGVYYDFGAATAGTGIGLQGEDIVEDSGVKLVEAAGSICPKGWKLPSSPRNHEEGSADYDKSYDIDGSFYHLFKQYGYDWTLYNGRPVLDMSNNTSLTYIPLYFAKAGFINPKTGVFSGTWGGMYLSSTVVSGFNFMDYYLDFNTNTNHITPSTGFNHYLGRSVRCLAR